MRDLIHGGMGPVNSLEKVLEWFLYRIDHFSALASGFTATNYLETKK